MRNGQERRGNGRGHSISILLCGAIIALTATAGSNPTQGHQKASGDSRGYTKRIVDQGITIDLTVDHQYPQSNTAGELREGEDVVVSFRLTDSRTGTPLNRINPAAWMARRPDDEVSDPQDCVQKVKLLLEGGFTGKADVDLNTYHVLAMNDDATISVVDPLFGVGGTKLLALVALKSPAEDWALTSDLKHLFVSMPDSNQVAVIDTSTWAVVANLDAGWRPTRLALQPDQAYLWVSLDEEPGKAAAPGVSVIRVADRTVAARIQTGKGRHQMAFSADSRFAFVTNSDEGTVSVVDTRSLKKVRDLRTGMKPSAIAFSRLAHAAYVTDEADGSIAVIDGGGSRILTHMKAEPGLGQIKFAPGDRLGFAVNPQKKVVHILDASLNKIVQTADLEGAPDQLAFTDRLAYIRLRDSEVVPMIPLDSVGAEGRPVAVSDFPGGQNALGKSTRPSPADAIVQAAGDSAVLVANPKDKSIYYYTEGMAAPMGSFSNYGREPRAVLVVDRSLREQSPGVYKTIARLTTPGTYDLALFIKSPRIIHCFELSVASNPELERKERRRPVVIEPLPRETPVEAGKQARLQFRLTDPASKKPVSGLNDLQVLIFSAPNWQVRQYAVPSGEGLYTVAFTPPEPGLYNVHLESQSIGLKFTRALALEAVSPKPYQKQ